MIHPTSIVDSGAHIAPDADIGPFAVVEADTTIGEGCRLAARTHVKRWTRLGARNTVLEGAILGGPPQHTSYKGEETWLEIGDDNVIGEYVTLHRGTSILGKTVIGNGNYFMGYSHIGHDCRVGNGVILTSYAGVAGHCTLEDKALLGAYAGVHQFVRVGTMAMLGAGAKVGQDIVPYIIVQGYPARPKTVNLIGLQRNGVLEPSRNLIRKMYKILFQSGLSLPESLRRLRDLPDDPVVRNTIEFIEGSKRGVCI